MKQHRLTAAMYRELDKIRKDHGGRLIPSDVMTFAENPSTALHWQFSWDDNKAARLWRLQEARAIIRAAVTVIGSQSEPVRTYVSLQQDRQNGGGYRATAEVLTEEESRTRLLEDALRDLQAFERRYRCLQELARIFEASHAATAAIKAKAEPKRRRSS